MNLYPHPQPARRARRAVAAFTMVEIAMALAVIGFALVAILGILPMGMDVQKDNRRETVINQDANFLIETIRGGAHGLDDLTNYVINITNFWTRYDVKGVAKCSDYDFYDYTNSRVSSSSECPPSSVADAMPLTSGTRIVGLLSTPKYLTNAATVADGNTAGISIFQSNYIVASVRSMSGVALEKFPQTNALIKNAFSYRLITELAPWGGTSNGMFFSAWTNYMDPNVVNIAKAGVIDSNINEWVAGLADPTTNGNPDVMHYVNPSDVKDAAEFTARANRWLTTRSLHPNLYELRLVFRWPLLPGRNTDGSPKVGNGRQTYRAMISGSLTNEVSPTNNLWFMRSQNYVYQQAQ